jgi:hypothetical protein
MIKTQDMQHAAISLARKLPMATEKIACPAAYRPAAPVGVRLQGTSVPVAGFQRIRIAPAMAALTTFGDRNLVAGVPGSVPRGRPV